MKEAISIRSGRKRVIKTDVEGKGSLSVPVTPTTSFPQASPVGLVAVPLKGGIELNWTKKSGTGSFRVLCLPEKTGEERV